MGWDEEGECALVICPALRTEFAVKLPGCRRGILPIPRLRLAPNGRCSHMLAQPSHLRNSACSSNIVGLLAMRPVGEVFTVSYDIIYSLIYLFLFLCFYLRNCIPMGLNRGGAMAPNGGRETPAFVSPSACCGIVLLCKFWLASLVFMALIKPSKIGTETET